VYGTARVLLAYAELGAGDTDAAQRGYRWLAAAERCDGGWGEAPLPGGGRVTGASSSVEETALAVEALAAHRPEPVLHNPLNKGLQWLTEAVLAIGIAKALRSVSTCEAVVS